jgi:Protein of unknown function (DUF2795)
LPFPETQEVPVAKWQVSEVQRYLKGADYPMSGDELSQLAKRNGAEDELVERLSAIGRQVDGPNAVMQELAGELGGPTPGPTQDRSPRDIEGPHWQVDDVQRVLRGAGYPASGDDLAQVAKGNGADDDLVEALRGIGRAGGPTEVMEALQPQLGGPQDG